MNNKRYILGVNTDSDDITIGKTDCILKQNLRSITSDSDGYGRNETVLGNVLIPNPFLPAGTNLTLNLPNSGYDSVNNRVFVFNWNSNGSHAIYVYSFVTALWNKVLLDNQVTGGLGFSKYNLIKAKVAGSNLYWNDRLTQPHKINIQAAIIANNSNNIVYGVVFTETTTTTGANVLTSTTVTFTSRPANTVAVRLFWRVIGTTVWNLTTNISVGATSPATFNPFTASGPVEYRFEFLGANITVREVVYSNILGAYTFPLLQSDILLIVRPSNYALSVLKVTDGAFPGNFIENEALQFSTRYVYATWERSVIAQWSQVTLPNLLSETFNAIDIKLPFSERIPQNIAQVELIVRYGNKGEGFVIHTWQNTGTEISDHNKGLTQLSYRFYNDQTGVGIGTEQFRPFDFIPLVEEDFDIARDRYFSGGGLYGYDTPAQSSLSVSIAAIPSTTSYAAQWRLATIVYRNRLSGAVFTYTWSILFIPSLGIYYNVPMYGNTSFWVGPSPGLIIDIDNPVYIAGSGTTITAAVSPATNNFAFELISATDAGLLATAVTATSSTSFGSSSARAFKSNSPYLISVEFLDEPTRRSGVTKPVKITTPVRTFSQTAFNQTVRWAVSNTTALVEIPVWATHYRVVRTANLKYGVFLVGKSKDTRYVTKDGSGVFQFAETTYAADRNGIAIDISAIEGYGYGYAFSEGDLVDLIRPSLSTVTLSVTGQYGQWVILSLKDIGAIGSGVSVMFEIYTPYKPGETNVFYEVGETFPVNNPGTSLRTYSTTFGFLNGDVSILQRTGFVAEAMSPNDKVWKVWNTDIGFANIIDTIGQQWRANQINWSNTYSDGTRRNGLSSFLDSNTKELPYEIGGIKLLSLVGKVQEQGTVMLAIGKLRTCSLYLGEVRITDNEGNTTIAASNNVIGTVDLLKKERGISNPESFVQLEDGEVAWIDTIAGKPVRYSVNGIDDIARSPQPGSDGIPTVRFWRLFCKQYLSMTQAQIEALGNRPFIFGGYDPQHKEVLWSLPRLLTAAPKGNLVDFSNIIFPYDTYDGQAKTMRFKQDGNLWDGHCSYVADGFFNDAVTLFLFKAGNLYRGNEGNVFFGTSYSSLLSILEQGGSDKVKEWSNIFLQANKKPDFTHLRSEYPDVQSSALLPANWSTDEGVQDASILRDRLTPGITPYITAQFRGRKMRTRAIKIHFVWNTSVIVNFVNTVFELSRGHTL